MTARTCLVVLGMHRSGTSALTRVISLLGAGLPENLMQSHADNPRGFWESERLASLHDRFLADCGSAWDDWRALPVETMEDNQLKHWRDEICSVLSQEFGTADFFVVKEPRICRFTPLFLSALETMNISVRIVIPFRNPLDVASSLAQRNSFPLEKGILLWLRHILDAEAASRQHPRVFLSYDRLLKDWRGAMLSVAMGTGTEWSRDFDEAAGEIEAFLTPDLRHHRHDQSGEALKPLAPWAQDTMHALTCLEQNAAAHKAEETLDRIRSEFDAAATLFGNGLPPLHGQLAHERKLREDIEEAVRAERDAKAHIEQVLSAERAEKARLEHQLHVFERKSWSTGWLLKKLGRKLLHVLRGMTRRREASLKKRELRQH